MSTNPMKGTRVRLKVPTSCFEGIDPDPLPIGSQGVIDAVSGVYVSVRWDTGYTLTHVFDDIEPLQKGDLYHD